MFACVQICSPAEKKSIDKMIDAGPQLAGSTEYNVVLSESEPRLLNQIKCNPITFTHLWEKKNWKVERKWLIGLLIV